MEVMVNATPIAEKDNKDKKPEQWDIDCWVKCIVESEEIKNDPKKMKYVLPEIEKKHSALMEVMGELKSGKEDKSMAGMKKKASDMPMEEEY